VSAVYPQITPIPKAIQKGGSLPIQLDLRMNPGGNKSTCLIETIV
jgi:hypothetical protein